MRDSFLNLEYYATLLFQQIQCISEMSTCQMGKNIFFIYINLDVVTLNLVNFQKHFLRYHLINPNRIQGDQLNFLLPFFSLATLWSEVKNIISSSSDSRLLVISDSDSHVNLRLSNEWISNAMKIVYDWKCLLVMQALTTEQSVSCGVAIVFIIYLRTHPNQPLCSLTPQILQCWSTQLRGC